MNGTSRFCTAPRLSEIDSGDVAPDPRAACRRVPASRRQLHSSVVRSRHSEHGDRFDLDQQFRKTQDGLDTGGGWKRIQPLLCEKPGALLVKRRVIPFDIAKITG